MPCWHVALAGIPLKSVAELITKRELVCAYRHHNFVVRGVFAVALRAMPYYSTFVKALAPSPDVANHPAYEATLKRHGIEYTKQLQHIVTTIDLFYVRNDIVSPQFL